jgi:hypothetical protein
MSAVGEPGYLPYCGNCTGLVRMLRGLRTFKCGVCGMETRNVNGEDMFDRTAPLPPHKPVTTMSDREKLDFVATGYNELMKLEADRRALMATMIRACLQRIDAKPSGHDRVGDMRTRQAKHAEGVKGLYDLVAMLEGEKR